ncbi:DUF4221 family protein [Neolewinella persica]|uniref:DUF4221 family protein n=1 Tax=Neolewinella persica TaxID=70998 RepID=UPI0003676639|nr:DUF4221 family protein [Neolewinella persica]
MPTLLFRGLLLLLFLSAFLTSCASKQDVFAELSEKKIGGPISAPRQSWHALIEGYEDEHGDKNFIGYNVANHSLDFFSISEEDIEFSQEIKFIFEGPGSIDRVRAIDYVNSDTIVVMSRYWIIMVDETGREFYRKNISTNPENIVDGLDLSSYHPSAKQSKGNRIALIGEELYLPLNYFAHDAYVDKNAYAEHIHLIGKLNIRTDEFEPLPIHFPAAFRKNLYGFANSFQFNYTQDRIIYSFHGFPEIYVYSMQSGKTKTLKPTYEFPATPIAGSMEISEHMLLMTSYNNSVIDWQKEWCYQAVVPPTFGEPATDIYLRAINLNTGEEKLSLLPQRRVFMGMVTLPDGIYLPYVLPTDDSMRYSRFTFEQQQLAE